MLVWSGMVVPGSKFNQLCHQISTVAEGGLFESAFERAEEPFNPSILPRAVRLDGLEADVQQ